jgi:hypothetical protein
MRTLLLLVFCLSLGAVATAQTEGQPAQGNPASINYVVGDLEKLDKLQLTDIYTAKLKRLQDLLPYLPFQKLEPQAPNDLRIPSTQSNDKGMKNLRESRQEYHETATDALTGLIPYANKDDLIGAILLLQNFINKLELVGLGMDDLGTGVR